MPIPYSIDQGIHYGEKSKLEMKNGKSFHLYEIWPILKYFLGTFHQAHELIC